MKNEPLVDRSNIWIMVALTLFGIAKITALICAAVIAVHGNIYIGSLLFIGALVFRINWTFLPRPNEYKSAVQDQGEHG